MLAINDMFYLSSPHIGTLFFEDVVEWLDLSNIRYTPRIKFSGKIGYDHMFDFVIPKSKEYGERIIQTISNPSKDNVESLVFRWQDTKETRAINSKLYVFINDNDKKVENRYMDAFSNYQLNPVMWSRKDDIVKELAA
jgi:hypothetical protein